MARGIRELAGAAVSGYAHPAYAESLAEFGTPQQLPRSRGWVLRRRIPGTDLEDAMWCYPLFCCDDWSQLSLDLDDLRGELVSLSVVTDPFGRYDEARLKECFRDVVVPFKQHFVVDLSQPPETFVQQHHRRNARRALRELQVERCAEPSDFLDDWAALYETLAERHGIRGIAAFSRDSFAAQLAVPGVEAFRATRDGATVGMLLWYAQGEVAYYHLGAYSERGYDLRASFALFSFAMEHFTRQGLRWLNLGGGAGTGAAGGESGLSRFKAGWSNDTRPAYFCGRVLDPLRYQELVTAKSVPPTEYFPAYRLGEFR